MDCHRPHRESTILCLPLPLTQASNRTQRLSSLWFRAVRTLHHTVVWAKLMVVPGTAVGGIGCVTSMYIWNTGVLASMRNRTFAVRKQHPSCPAITLTQKIRRYFSVWRKAFLRSQTYLPQQPCACSSQTSRVNSISQFGERLLTQLLKPDGVGANIMI